MGVSCQDDVHTHAALVLHPLDVSITQLNGKPCDVAQDLIKACRAHSVAGDVH